MSKLTQLVGIVEALDEPSARIIAAIPERAYTRRSFETRLGIGAVMNTIVKPQDRTVDIDGLNMHYLDWGNPTKPTIVLLHGLRGHAHSWDDVSEALSPDFHVLALDQRGRGLTDWAKDGDYGIDAFVGDLVGFCGAVGLEKLSLMGHSMGARNSIAFADKHAHMLEKLVLSEFFIHL